MAKNIVRYIYIYLRIFIFIYIHIYVYMVYDRNGEEKTGGKMMKIEGRKGKVISSLNWNSLPVIFFFFFPITFLFDPASPLVHFIYILIFPSSLLYMYALEKIPEHSHCESAYISYIVNKKKKNRSIYLRIKIYIYWW